MQNHSNEVEYAGFWVRLAAYGIDIIIVTVGLLVVRLLFLGINALIAGTFLEGGILFHYTLKDIVLYALQVIYFILFTYHTGTTLGKKALNLKVIRSDGEEKLSLLTVIYRETIGRFLCGFILWIGYIIAGIDKEKRGLHDILCDTRVIYAKKVKVYPVYQGQLVRTESDYVPRMVDESEVQTNMQDDIQVQWDRILNPQKEEVTPPCENQNIEGNS